MPDAKRIIVVTGASGYLGARVVSLALARGFAVHSLGRTALGAEGVVDVPFDISRLEAIALPTNTAALLHLAANTSGASELSGQQEVAAARMLATALPSGARFIFVSSQSAAEKAPSVYGRTKWHIENLVRSFGGLSVRPGLVFGGAERGLFGRITAVVRKCPILPMFILPRPMVQPIHVDDVAEGLLRLVDAKWPTIEPVCFAAEAIPFDRFLSAIARHRLGVRRIFLPIPTYSVQMILELIERLSGRSIGAAQFRSLAKAKLMDTAGDLARFGLVLRPLEEGLRQRGVSERRRLIHEGARMLTYVLGITPGLRLIRRYVRFAEAGHATAILGYPVSKWWSAIAIAVLDRQGATDTQERLLVGRIHLAVRIAEASPESAARFIGEVENRTGPRRFRAAFAIASAVMRELLVRLARPLLRDTARRILRSPARI